MNINDLKNTLIDCQDVVFREFNINSQSNKKIWVIYTDNMIDSNAMREFIMSNIMITDCKNNTLNDIKENILAVAEVQDMDKISDCAMAVMTGDIIIIMEEEKTGLKASLKFFPNRGVNKPDTETVIQGPKDAFLEVSAMNIVLVRRRINNYKLKLVRKQVGNLAKLDIAIMYIEDIVAENVLEHIKKELDNLVNSNNTILDSGSLEQILEKNYLSPFPQMQLTERPDKTSSALLEGRVILLVDNSPFSILLPTTLNTFFQSAEDYYERWAIMSGVRVLRYIAGFLAVSIPGIFIALTTYHSEIMPTAFALKVATTRQNIPFNITSEILTMEIAFELLREAGIRLPSAISSTIGIVGGIIIGSAAVEAGIVSPLVVIASAITAVCTFVIPNVAFVSAIRIVKYFVILLSACFGLFGTWIALMIILIHLSGLVSFGVPYLYPFCSYNNLGNDWKDTLIRFPFKKIKGLNIFSRKVKKG